MPQSKWIEVFPMSSTTASATIWALHFLYATHGLPEAIVPDNGSQIVAQEIKDFLKSNGICHYLSLPYHPALNGSLASRKNLQRINEDPERWARDPSRQISMIPCEISDNSHTATECAPAELLMGRKIRTRLDIM